MTPTRPDPRDTDPLGFEEPCPRCDWLRAEPAERLIFMWSPEDTSDAVARGERLRSTALAMHAFEGHPQDWPRPSRLRRLIGWWRGG